MSAIDCYSYEVLGVVKGHPGIPIYKLLQDVEGANGNGFEGKAGDLLIGGGGGEAAAIRIDIREAIKWITDVDYACESKKDWFEDIVKHFWSTTSTYEFCCMYKGMGWDPSECPVETWLATHLVKFIIDNYRDEYTDVIGPDWDEDEEYDGRIFRLPKHRYAHCIRNCISEKLKNPCEGCR